LTGEDKDHWNNLAEEEKKNHAKKYPGYRYTPRRNGKNKNCNFCRQKAIRQQQAQVVGNNHNLHNQRIQQQQQVQQVQQQHQHQQQQQIQQVPQVQLQQVQAQQVQAQQQYAAAQLQQDQYQQYFQGQTIPQAQQLGLNGNGAYLTTNNHNQQFIISSNPLAMVAPAAPQNYQFAFTNNTTNPNNNNNNDLLHNNTNTQEKLSPLSNGPTQSSHPSQQQYGIGATTQMLQPTGPIPHHPNNSITNTTSEYGGASFIGSGAGVVGGYEQQRYGSLPNAINHTGSSSGSGSAGSGAGAGAGAGAGGVAGAYGFDAYNS